MSYLSALIALFTTPEVVGQDWFKSYLVQLTNIELWFYHASWWIWGFFVGGLILFGLYLLLRYRSLEALVSMGGFAGCVGVVLLVLPALSWVTWKLTMNMASAVDINGTIISTKFWVNLIIFILIGSG